LAVYALGRQLGTDIFPRVDAGQFQVRLRAPTGTRIEQTEALTQEALEFIKKEVGPENVAITLGYVGLVPSSNPVNSIYLWMGGPEEAVVRVSLKPGTARVEELKHTLREKLTPHLRDWLGRKWLAEGVPADRARKAAEVRLSFEPADIVNDVMSFGSPTPVEVVVSGPKAADNRAHAEKVYAELAKVGTLRDLQFAQTLDYPTVEVTIDRERAALSGVSADQVARSLVEATSSSRFTVPNYWRDPASGIGYQVQVEIPQARMRSPADIEMVPVKHNGGAPLLVRDVARVSEGAMPGQIDRYNMRRLVSMTANIAGADLGRVAEQVGQAVAAAGAPPAGVTVDVRGQIEPLRALFGGLAPGAAVAAGPVQSWYARAWAWVDESFRGLTLGLAFAVVTILLLLTAYFQSLRLALVAVASVPAVLAGVVLALWATGTTLNLQSFMGSIMAVGVAVANAILLVTFAERNRRGGLPAKAAAVAGARGRVRAILMTTCAMVAGMVPMALGLGEGGEQVAPLGRAVIGGLLAGTAATLGVLPAVFALLMARAPTRSSSLDPTDPESPYYVPA
jgi:multidrug efflux pump subunit AcrB